MDGETIRCRCPNCRSRLAVDVSNQPIDDEDHQPWRLRATVVSCEDCHNRIELMFYERAILDDELADDELAD